MNAFDWAKINTSFQFYSKETLKGMARCQHYYDKVAHLEKRFFFSFFSSLHQSVRVDFAQEYIYIYIIESKYDTARREGVNQGRMRGGRAACS